MAPAERRLLIGACLVALAVPALALAADPNNPTKRHTAADTRTATRIALHRSDFVAGWKRVKTDTSPDDVCKGEPDESKLVETADVDPTFESADGAVDVDSEVQVFRTAAMSSTDWSYGTLARLRTCAKDEFARRLGANATFALLRTTAPSIAGVQTKAFRLVIPAKVKGTPVVVTSDLVALHRGRVSVMLSATGPRGSYRASQLTPLAGALARRLTASS